MRRSTPYLGLTAVSLAGLLFVLLLHPPLMRGRFQERIEAERDLVRGLGLTDLCLFTDSRYSRHPSKADLHSAFQDNPGSFDLFPSGSMVLPPLLRDIGHGMDR